MTDTIEIWTDGSCRGNPGPGGWAFLKRLDGVTIERFGSVSGRTDNARMEMVAAIQALRSIKRIDVPTVVNTDSQFLTRGVNEWLPNWVAKGWRGSNGPIQNREHWEDLKRLIDNRAPEAPITFQWIKGHAGQQENERVNTLAQAASKKAAAVPNSATAQVQFNPDTGLDEPLFNVEQ